MTSAFRIMPLRDRKEAGDTEGSVHEMLPPDHRSEAVYEPEPTRFDSEGRALYRFGAIALALVLGALAFVHVVARVAE